MLDEFAFGALLKELRLKQGESLHDLAIHLDVSVEHLSEVEAGSPPLTEEFVRKAARHFNQNQDEWAFLFDTEIRRNSEVRE